MADPTTIESLRGLVLSASEIKSLTGWPDAMVEDYLNIVDNFILLAETIDSDISQDIEEIPTDFSNGSIPFASGGFLVEENPGLKWDNGLVLDNLTASRLTASNGSKKVVSVADLTAWIAGTLNQITVTDNGDGTVTLATPQDTHTGASPTFSGLTIGVGAAGVDYSISFNGETNDGLLTWMEDEDYFAFSDDILNNTSEKHYFRDTAIGIYSQADTFLDLFADGAVRIGDSSGGAPTNYLGVNPTGSVSFNGTARIDWNKWTADSVTINGFTSADTVADLQTAHDGNIYTMTEVAGGSNYLIIDFVSVTAFNWVNALSSYDGSSSHALHIQLYNWNTTAWDTFDCNQDEFTDSGTIRCNKDFFVPSDTNYIGTGGDAGKVRVRYSHTTTTVNNHKVYIDVVALYQ